MDRRTQVADAALDVIAAAGMKGLTHRAVDEAADAPTGTTSNYHRTRAALVAAAVDRLEQRDLAVWASGQQAAPPVGADELAERLAAYLAVFAGEHADLTRVRLMLSLDQPDAVVAGHVRFVAVARQLVASAGIADPDLVALWIADYCDGMLLHEVTTRRGQPVDVESHRRAIRRLLHD